MKKLLPLFILFLIAVSNLEGQNLVPNPSFEIDTACPNNISEIYYSTPWFQPCIHSGNTTVSSSSDLFNACDSSEAVSVPYNGEFSGYQLARTGIGYAGIFCHYTVPIHYREYLEVPLITPLVANNRYCVEFYVNLPDFSHYAISNLGAYFSADSLLDTTNYHTINVTPQVENPLGHYLTDTVNWMLVSGNFIATGGEKFMTIGNFHTPASTDTTTMNSSNPSATVYYYIDDVSVIPCNVGIEDVTDNASLQIYPNPATEKITIEVSGFTFQKANLKVINVLGECTQQLTTSNQQLIIDLSGLAKGIYFIELQTGEGVMRKRFVKE